MVTFTVKKQKDELIICLYLKYLKGLELISFLGGVKHSSEERIKNPSIFRPVNKCQCSFTHDKSVIL